MKRLTSILALVLAGVMLICALPLSAGAYGTADGKLIITHINVGPSLEGSAIIANGRNYKTTGQLGTFAVVAAVYMRLVGGGRLLQNSNHRQKQQQQG